jgi:septal ring-binding cell division protein DamX
VKRDTTMAAQYLAAASALGDGPAEDALQQVLAEIAAEAAPTTTVAPTPTSPIAAEAAPAVVADEPLLRGEDWIAAQDPARYTIQVMALNDRGVLEGIVAGYEDLAPFAIYTVQKSTSPLHVLVQGSYPDVASARAVQNRFPRKIQKKDKLWIRRFERVQALLE